MRNTYRAVALALTLILLIPCLSCERRLPKDYREYPFVADLEYELNGVSVVCALRTSEGACGDMRISFSLPRELSLVEVVRIDGKHTMLLDGRESVGEEGAKALSRAASLLMCDGERSFIKRSNDGGNISITWQISDEFGNIELVTNESGIPVSVSQGELFVRVTRFEELLADYYNTEK